MKSYPPYWLQIFNGISTTNLRIYLTLFLAMGTAISYWVTGNAPDNNWLYFICGIAGVDVLQFASKRFSDSRRFPQQMTNENVTISTDIKELSQDKG